MSVPNQQPDRANAESPYKSVGGLSRVANAIRYSIRGLALAWRIESAFRQELTLAAILLPTAILLPIPIIQRLALAGSTVMVLVIELLNSSIEAAIDRISLDHHNLSGRAKDFGSAAVFLALMFCAISWACIAGPVLFSAIAGL
jgi:diacylglycerol kinase (ATP)